MPPNQKGSVPLLVLIAAIGLIGVLGILSFAPFKNQILSALFQKPSSFAASNSTFASFGTMNLSSTFNSIGVEVFFFRKLSCNCYIRIQENI